MTVTCHFGRWTRRGYGGLKYGGGGGGGYDGFTGLTYRLLWKRMIVHDFWVYWE